MCVIASGGCVTPTRRAPGLVCRPRGLELANASEHPRRAAAAKGGGAEWLPGSTRAGPPRAPSASAPPPPPSTRYSGPRASPLARPSRRSLPIAAAVAPSVVTPPRSTPPPARGRSQAARARGSGAVAAHAPAPASPPPPRLARAAGPDCGLKARRCEEAIPALRNVVTAAALVRTELAGGAPAAAAPAAADARGAGCGAGCHRARSAFALPGGGALATAATFPSPSVIISHFLRGQRRRHAPVTPCPSAAAEGQLAGGQPFPPTPMSHRR
jgi:hypothetical protein